MNVKTEFQETFHVKDITTDAMTTAITDWYDLYYGTNLPDEEDGCQRLPVTVVNKIQKAVFAEYEADSKNEFAKQCLEAIDKKKKKVIQQALIGGCCFIKPIMTDPISYVVVPRNNCIILGRDTENRVTDIGLTEQSEEDGYFYTLMERRYIEDDKLIIESKLFKSDKREERGSQVPLDTLPRYASLEDTTELAIDNIGMAEVNCPAENCVDGSDDPVSVYAAATDLIHNINLNEAQINGEFERGMSRIIASADYLKSTNGTRALVDDVFTGVDDDPENVGIQIFAPAFREQSYLARKREYLRNIESMIGLKRGLLSEVEMTERTATEITSSAGDYNLTVMDFQEMWENAIKELVVMTAQLAGIYHVKSATVSEKDIVMTWGNGVLYDRDKTWAEYLQLAASGLIKPEIAVAWYFNLDWKNDKDLEKIRAEYMPQMEQLLAGEEQTQ